MTLARPWPLLGLALLLLYTAALVVGAPATAQWLGHLNEHGHAHLHAHGHPFVDAREWLGIPNAADVLSNLPFALVAFWGWQLRRAWPQDGAAPALHLFFVGLLGTAIGSSVYHWAPTPLGLVLDRLGMALAFAGLLALAVHERVGEREGRVLGWTLAPLALLAAALPLSGNLLPWALVQGGGVLALPLLALRASRPGSIGLPLVGIVALYAVAKVLEGADAAVFEATGGWVSGHTLKHLAAAAAAALVVLKLARRRSATSPAQSGGAASR